MAFTLISTPAARRQKMAARVFFFGGRSNIFLFPANGVIVQAESIFAAATWRRCWRLEAELRGSEASGGGRLPRPQRWVQAIGQRRCFPL